MRSDSMKNKNSKNTKLLRLCSLLILIPMLLLSACNKNGNNATQTTTQDPNPPIKVTVGELFYEINQNKLPPLEEYPDDYEGLDGARTPIQYLNQAPQDLVGKKLQLSFDEMLEGDIFYRYSASTKQLVVMYCRDSVNTSLHTQAMIVLQTDYADMKEFLSLTDLWTGTVTAVKIVGGLDIDYSRQDIKRKSDVKATEHSTVCYGYLSYNQDMVVYDNIQPNNQNYGKAFDLTVTRFGIE